MQHNALAGRCPQSKIARSLGLRDRAPANDVAVCSESEIEGASYGADDENPVV